VPPNPSSPGGGHRRRRKKPSLGTSIGHAFHTVEHTATAPKPHPVLGTKGLGRTVQSAVRTVEHQPRVKHAFKASPPSTRRKYRRAKRKYRRTVRRLDEKNREARAARRAQREAVNAPIKVTRSDILAGLLGNNPNGIYTGKGGYILPGVKNPFHSGILPIYEKHGSRYATTGKDSAFFPIDTNEAGTVQGAFAAPALTVLRQLARPVHGIAGFADELVKGHSLSAAGHAAGRGFLHNEPFTFSTVLQDAGVKNKTLATMIGFGLDMGLDPTTYFTFGTGSVAREAAAKGAYKSALVEGETEAVARKAAKNAYKQGEQRAGFTIGASGKIPFVGRRHSVSTSGRTTAALARKTRVNKVLQGARNTPLAQVTGKALAPDFRPRDIPEEQWSAYLDANRRKAASSRTELHRAERRVQALQRHLPDKEAGQRLVHGRESGNVSEDVAAAEQMFGREMNRIAGRERRAGILGGTRDRYVPHIPEADVAGNAPLRGSRRGGRAASNPHAKKRAEGTIAEKNQGLPEHVAKFSDNPVHLLGARSAKSAASVADAHYLRDLANHVGRKLPAKGRISLGQNEVAFAIGKDSFKPLEEEVRGKLTGRVDAKAVEKAR
jgi:hypothetical protein